MDAAQQARVIAALGTIPSDDPRVVRQCATKILAAAMGVDGALHCKLLHVDGGLQYGAVCHVGDADFAGLAARLEGSPSPAAELYDHQRPKPTCRTRFQRIDAIVNRKDFLRSKLYRSTFEPAGMHDQLRLLIYDRQRFLGFVGGYRRIDRPIFSRNDEAAMQPWVQRVISVFTAAQHLEDQQRGEWPLHLLLAPSGRLLYASGGVGVVLSRSFRAQLSTLVRAFDSGTLPTAVLTIDDIVVRPVRLVGQHEARYLVMLSTAILPQLAWDAELSPRQREVADLLRHSLTVEETAKELQLSAQTVKTHTRALYQRLGISSRVELVRLAEQPRRSLAALQAAS